MIDPDDRDERLAALLADLDARRRTEGGADVEAVARLHPDLAAELRELWAAHALADHLAESARPEPPDLPRPEWLVDAAGGSPFEILAELGRGGMGVVHLARQPCLGRVVAVKTILRGTGATAYDLARFRAEARAAARLDHPHIVPIHDVGSHDGQPFLVMRYVEGTTLARRLADGPLAAAEAAAILAPVARAIDHAHGRGVLHRDLKPANILLDEKGVPLVTDFGLAKRIDPEASQEIEHGSTRTGLVVGTPSYMAPEQATFRRGPIGPGVDVYGLGAILYHLLTGRPPFQAATSVETLLLVLEQDPVPPRVLNPRADPDLEMVALQCLQKNPALRYPSALALADDLDRFRAGEPVAARSTTLRALATRWLGETPNAVVLENWGGLWMSHAVVLLLFTAILMSLKQTGVTARGPYFLVFTLGLGLWAAAFWEVRRRMGPIAFVERQLAHIWAAGVISINTLLAAEWAYGLPPLTLAPLFGLTNGMLFIIKAGVLSGEFYAYGVLTILTVIPGILYPRIALPLFALVSALGFVVPGWKYRRRHVHARRLRGE